MNDQFRKRSLPAAALLAIFVAATPAIADEVFRWVDKDGNVHFGDSPPPEYATQFGDPRAPAENQEDADAARQAQADKVLLQTYGGVDEIEAVRDERLESLRYQDRLTESYLANLNRQLQDLEKAAAADNPEPGLDAEIAETRSKIEIYQGELTKSEKKQNELTAKFDKDITRFQQLTASSPNS
jgi:hypothetical protein